MNRVRKFLWRILGIDYQQALRVHDYVFLKNDKFTKTGIKTYDNGALVWRWTNEEINIGKYCSIANNVRFIVDEGFHQNSDITSFPLIQNLFKDVEVLPSGIKKEEFVNKFNQRKGIIIGNDVWIGMGSYIMPGVKVGNGVTIAANSVVTKDIADYSIVGGSPAKLIKMKHSDLQIKKLNKIAWWNWNINTIKKRSEDFYTDINIFIQKYE